MKNKKIHFSASYDKIAHKQRFTTIRGKSWATKFEVNDIVDIMYNGGKVFHAKIISIEKITILNIDREILREDIRRLGQTNMNNFQVSDFLDEINSNWPRSTMKDRKADLHTIVTIITLRRSRQ